MAFTVDITPKTPTGVIDQTQQFTATPSGETGGGTITYAWTVDDVPQDGAEATFSYVLKGPAGQKTIKVVATNTVPDTDAETAEATTTITVQNKTQTTTLAVTPDSPAAGVIGTPVEFTAALASQPSGASATYQWYVDDSQVGGETNSTFNYTPSTSGVKTIKCVAQVTATDYDAKEVTSNEVSLTVTDKVAPEPEGELPYVHPLPHRTSAYIWCGWWVMDEIQKMTEEGKDWKTEDPDSKYYLHRYTLQKMLKDYPEVDVQESRNGYIIHKTALETGIIYTYP
ncbi:capsid and scaffold protein [Escherichia phage KIT06]|nr:capsid and scaffold protein [Escherichia phage KIT06]